MCGIAGKVGQVRVSESEVLRMCEAIAHRGPDDSGTFVEGNVGLGMRRLSIVDVAGGHQPMSNEDGSVVVVFNGEIYNFPSLYEELVGKGTASRPGPTPKRWCTFTRRTARRWWRGSAACLSLHSGTATTAGC